MKLFIEWLLKKLLEIEKLEITVLPKLKNILIIRQHNQFGDLLASSSLFVALKDKYSDCNITLIVSPQNYRAVTKNPYVDNLFNFDKKKLFNPSYIIRLYKVLHKKYDICIVPSTVSLSTTSALLCRFSNSYIKLGVGKLNGVINKYSYLYNLTVPIDSRKYPDQHVADLILEIVKKFGITTKKLAPIIGFEKEHVEIAKEFIQQLPNKTYRFLIGLHVGAGKPQNRWPLDNYIELIKKLNEKYNAAFYLTGSGADKTELDYMFSKSNDVKLVHFKDKNILELAALISITDLFITNDTGVMHVAGSTQVAQISIFGPTNPLNWSPIGENKYYCKSKSEFISELGLDEVFALSIKILEKK